MKRLRRAAVLVTLVETMKEQGSWCGETNIQKASYFLQEMMDVPLGFEFILYKYGPYSFELTDELTGLLADSILDLGVRDARYGPCYGRGPISELILSKFPKTVCQYRPRIDFVASRLGEKGIGELERLATALFVSLRQKKGSPVECRATELRSLKSHIGEAASLEAIKEVDAILSDAKAVLNS